jgi:hypothetical protein
VLGRDAIWVAGQAGVAVPPGTRVLLAPIDLVVPEEPLAGPTPCPVLGLVRVPSAEHGIRAAQAALRLGAGSLATVYSADQDTILAYGTQVPVRRVCVNGGDHPASAGIAAYLRPEQLVTWTTVG